MDKQSLQQWGKDPVTQWVLDKLDKVQEQGLYDSLRAANNNPVRTVSIVSRAEGRYDLVDAIKELIKGEE